MVKYNKTIYLAIITMKTATQFGESHIIYYIDNHGLKEKYKLSTDIHLFPDKITDVIYAFPVFFLSFMCHFNIPQVHSELTRPTRKRMRIVLITVVLACYVLYATVAFFGYFYSFEYTCGNILLNYNQNDPIITLARLCLGFVILFTFPLLILPARGSMHNLLNLIFTFKNMNLEDEGNDSRSELFLDEICDNNDNNDDNNSKENVTRMISMNGNNDKQLLQKRDQIKGSIFGSDDEDDDENGDEIINESLLGAPSPYNSADGYALFAKNINNNNFGKNGSVEYKVKNDNDKLSIEDEEVIFKTIKENVNKLQVVNKNKTPLNNNMLVSPNDYFHEKSHSKSPYSSNSRSIQRVSIATNQSQQQRVPLTYNTFNSNPTSTANTNINSNNAVTSKLLNKKPKIYTNDNNASINNTDKKASKSSSSLLGLFKNSFIKSNDKTSKSKEEEYSVSSKGTEVKSIRDKINIFLKMQIPQKTQINLPTNPLSFAYVTSLHFFVVYFDGLNFVFVC